MKKIKRITSLALALLFCFTSIIPAVSASHITTEQMAMQELNDHFFVLLSDIHRNPELFNAPDFELDQVHIGTPFQSYKLEGGTLTPMPLYFYPFL